MQGRFRRRGGLPPSTSPPRRPLTATWHFFSPSAHLRPQLQQVPQIPVQVFEDSNGPVSFDLGLPHERNPPLDVVRIVSPEVVGIEKQKDSATRLIAYECFLLGRRGSREHQARAVGSRGCDHHPALVLFR